MIFLSFLTIFSNFLASVKASPPLTAKSCTCSSQEAGPRTIYQFANGTWVENIAVRANGNLLVTLIDRPELYEINPNNPTCASLIYQFPGYKSMLGITEATLDVFTVILGNLTDQGTDPESFSVWKADFNSGDRAQVSKITDIPEAIFLNGMSTLDSTSGTVLIGDSTKGVVFRLDTLTGKYCVVLEDETFKPRPNARLPIGVNGIRVLDNYLYYVNTFSPLYGRVRIDTVSGKALGPYEVISTGITGDDLAIDKNKIAYVAGAVTNVVARVELNGESKVLAGNLNSSLVASATSAAFGRTRLDEHVLYVTTGGGQDAPVNGTFTEGGKIVALNF